MLKKLKSYHKTENERTKLGNKGYKFLSILSLKIICFLVTACLWKRLTTYWNQIWARLKNFQMCRHSRQNSWSFILPHSEEVEKIESAKWFLPKTRKSRPELVYLTFINIKPQAGYFLQRRLHFKAWLRWYLQPLRFYGSVLHRISRVFKIIVSNQ